MSKFKFKGSNNLGQRLIGAATGAALNTATNYAVDSFASSYKSYSSYAKIGLGLTLPFVAKNKMVESGSDVLLGIGLSEVLSGLISDESSNSTVEGIGTIAKQPFPNYKTVVRNNLKKSVKVDGLPID